MPGGTLDNNPTGSEVFDGMQPLDQTQADNYTGTQIDNEFSFEEGVVMLPVALTDADIAAGKSPVAIGRLHPPIRLKRVRYQAKKQNAPPILPAPTSTGNFIFLGGKLNLPTPIINQTYTQFDWKATAEYIFVEDNRSEYEDGFVLTDPPWQYQSQSQNFSSLGGVVNPPNGAAAEGGLDVQVGYTMSLLIDPNSPAGWGYNCPSFYPGIFFNAAIVDGNPF